MKKTASVLITLLLCSFFFSALADGVIDTIMNSKTTQAFKAEALAEEDLNTILAAGLSTASAMNQQPWHFAVITNQEIMKEISGGMGMGNLPFSIPGAPANATDETVKAPVAAMKATASLGDSPVAIIVYLNESTASPDPHFDCGLACQNMVIAANGLGYGTKIVSIPTLVLNGDAHDAWCQKLGVDTSYKAVAVLLLGHENPEVDGSSGASVRSTMEEKVSFIK